MRDIPLHTLLRDALVVIDSALEEGLTPTNRHNLVVLRDELNDAREVARKMGEDLATEKERAQALYDLLPPFRRTR